MFSFQRQCETIDDAVEYDYQKIDFASFEVALPSQDLQQLANAIEMLGFIDETQENVVDLFSYEGAQSEKFPVNTMKHRFQEVTFARIFRVEEFQQLK